MHTPSLVQIIVTGLAATSAVASFEVSNTGLSRRYVGALVALAAPAFAAPTIEQREPHHAGKKAKGKGKKAKAARRQAEEDDCDEEDDTAELATREPHHAGKKAKGKGKKKNKRDEDALVERDEELETREPHQYVHALTTGQDRV